MLQEGATELNGEGEVRHLVAQEGKRAARSFIAPRLLGVNIGPLEVPDTENLDQGNRGHPRLNVCATTMQALLPRPTSNPSDQAAAGMRRLEGGGGGGGGGGRPPPAKEKGGGRGDAPLFFHQNTVFFFI